MAISFKVTGRSSAYYMDGKTTGFLKMQYDRSSLTSYIVIRFENPSTKEHKDYYFRETHVDADKKLTFVPDTALAALAGISSGDASKPMRMEAWIADSGRSRVSDVASLATVYIVMPKPVLNPGWITLSPYKRQPDSLPTGVYIKGHYMWAKLNPEYIDLAEDTTVTGFSGGAGSTYFQSSLLPSLSNPGGTAFTGNLYGLLNTAGDVEFTFTVTDSRGQKASETFTAHVYEYFTPTISGVEIFRCDETGAANEEGCYVSGKAVIKYSAMDGAITLMDHYVEFRETSAAETERHDIESGDPILLGNGAVTPVCSYYLKIFVRDSTYAQVQYETVLSSANASFNIMEGGHGAAFGRLSSREHVLDSAWEISSDGGIYAGTELQGDGSYVSKAYMDEVGNIHADGNISAQGDITAKDLHAETVRAGDGAFTGNVTGGAGSFGYMDISGEMSVGCAAGFAGEISASGGIAGVTNYPDFRGADGTITLPQGMEVATGGRWIDGKPIYRFLWKGTTTHKKSQKVMTNFPNDITPDTVISLTGMLKRSDGQWMPIPNAYYGNSDHTANLRTYEGNGIYLGLGDGFDGAKTVVIIAEYTK